MVEGLTSSATDQGSVAGIDDRIPDDSTRSKIRFRRPRRSSRPRVEPLPNTIQTQKIPVTLAERPHPFPSRTRKLSSPAPKILRGQPFGKIGRRQDFCVSGRSIPSARRGDGRDDGRPAILRRDDRTVGADRRAEPAATTPSGRPGARLRRRPPGSSPRICPYLLVAPTAAWRSASAPQPRPPLRRGRRRRRRSPPTKQRRLLPDRDHVDCATFRAARPPRRRALAAGADPRRSLPPTPPGGRSPRTTPVVLEPRPAGRSASPASRSIGAAVRSRSSALMVVRASRSSPSSRFAAPSAAPAPSPSRRRRRRAVRADAATPDADAAEPSARRAVAIRRVRRRRAGADAGPTYTVKTGDTLIGIAAEFRTTAAAIRQARTT